MDEDSPCSKADTYQDNSKNIARFSTHEILNKKARKQFSRFENNYYLKDIILLHIFNSFHQDW